MVEYWGGGRVIERGRERERRQREGGERGGRERGR